MMVYAPSSPQLCRLLASPSGCNKCLLNEQREEWMNRLSIFCYVLADCSRIGLTAQNSTVHVATRHCCVVPVTLLQSPPSRATFEALPATLSVLRHAAQCSFPSFFSCWVSVFLERLTHTKHCARAFPYILYFVMYTVFGLKKILFYWCGNKGPERPSPWLYRNKWGVPGLSPGMSDPRLHVPSFAPRSLPGLCLTVALLFLSVYHPCPASRAVSSRKTQMGVSPWNYTFQRILKLFASVTWCHQMLGLV